MLEAPMIFNSLVLNDQSQRRFGYTHGSAHVDPNAQKWWIKVTAVDGLWDADVRDDRQTIPNRDGELSGVLLYSGKTITISGEVRAKNLRGLRDGQRTLTQAFGDLEAHDLIFQSWIDDIPLAITCKKIQPISMTEAQPDAKFARPFTVTLRADDPRAYATVAETLDIVQDDFGAVQRVRFYPRVYNLPGFPRRRNYQVVLGASSNVATNDGTAETFPISRFNGPMTNPTITNVATGEKLQWDGLTLAATDSMTVNHATSEILLDDSIPYYTGFNTLESTFWVLVPGDNPIAFNAFTSSAGAAYSLEWRDAYR